MLQFQARTFTDTMRDVRTAAGPLRLVLGALSPLVRIRLWWNSPMRGSSATPPPSRDPSAAMAARWFPASAHDTRFGRW